MSAPRQSKPRNRPSFRQILLHLDIAAADVLGAPQETYFKSQVCTINTQITFTFQSLFKSLDSIAFLSSDKSSCHCIVYLKLSIQAAVDPNSLSTWQAKH